MQHGVGQPGKSLVVNRAGFTDAHLAVQPIDAALDELRAPSANGAGVQLQTRVDGAISLAISIGQDDLGSTASAEGSERLRTTRARPETQVLATQVPPTCRRAPGCFLEGRASPVG